MKKNKYWGRERPPFIVAEMSSNHNGSFRKAVKIIEAAADAGVDAVKLQTLKPENLTLKLKKGEFFINDPDNQWRGTTLYKIFEKAYTPWEWHKPLFQKCKKLGIYCFSTPFDETAVDFLEELRVPFYKIASFENVHLPLISKISKTGKPVIMSTGMATVGELDDAVRTAKSNGCTDLTLLKCISSYPADPKDFNLITLPHMRDMFDCEVGISDHSLGIGVALTSVVFGGVLIEKHFILSRKDKALDANFSMEPYEMKSLVNEVKTAWRAVGKVSYGPSNKEQAFRKHRRSLYIAQDMKKGDVFTKDNLKVIRPGLGLSPKHYFDILGKTIPSDAKKGQALTWEVILKK